MVVPNAINKLIPAHGRTIKRCGRCPTVVVGAVYCEACAKQVAAELKATFGIPTGYYGHQHMTISAPDWDTESDRISRLARRAEETGYIDVGDGR